MTRRIGRVSERDMKTCLSALLKRGVSLTVTLPRFYRVTPVPVSVSEAIDFQKSPLAFLAGFYGVAEIDCAAWLRRLLAEDMTRCQHREEDGRQCHRPCMHERWMMSPIWNPEEEDHILCHHHYEELGMAEYATITTLPDSDDMHPTITSEDYAEFEALARRFLEDARLT